MKWRILLISSLLLGIAAAITAFSGDDADYPSGAPAGNTGSPGDGQSCTSCHGGTATTVTGYITSDIPTSGYTAGTTYNLTVTVPGATNLRKGFEVSPQNATGTQLGTLIAGTGNHLTGGTKYVTHSSGSMANPAVWSFQWTAPASGTGTVTFYGAFCVSEPVTQLSTLVVNESAAPLTVQATSTPGAICSGSTSQLNAVPAGGSGTYTYSWISNPAGFTSTLQNPVVQPVMSTEYTVTVSDGTQNANASTSVNVTQPPTAFAGNDATYCTTVTQILLAGTATNYNSVLWTTSGDGTFSSSNILNPIYFPGTGDTTNRFVNLTLTATPISPCTTSIPSTMHITFDPCTGIGDQNYNAARITLTPNPASGFCYLGISGSGRSEYEFYIVNLNGKAVATGTIRSENGNVKRIDLSGLAKGIYFIEVRSDAWIQTGKLIIN